MGNVYKKTSKIFNRRIYKIQNEKINRWKKTNLLYFACRTRTEWLINSFFSLYHLACQFLIHFCCEEKKHASFYSQPTTHRLIMKKMPCCGCYWLDLADRDGPWKVGLLVSYLLASF